MSTVGQPTAAEHRGTRTALQPGSVTSASGPALLPYDLVKEFLVALLAVAVLVVVLAVRVLRRRTITRSLAVRGQRAPVDFAQTAITRARRHERHCRPTGRPSNNASPNSTRSIGPFSRRAGPGCTTRSTRPRTSSSARFAPCPIAPALDTAVNAYTSATGNRQARWTAAYEKGVPRPPSPRRPRGAVRPLGPVGR